MAGTGSTSRALDAKSICSRCRGVGLLGKLYTYEGSQVCNRQLLFMKVLSIQAEHEAQKLELEELVAY